MAAMVLGLAGPARGEVTEAMRKALDRVIEEKAEAHLVPGIAVVVMEGEKVAYSYCRGSAGTGEITPETPFIVGSISKLFTATAVMQLVDRRKIELDAPVQRYLPDFRVADADASGRITVRQLLNQNSGLPTNAPRATEADRTLQDHVKALSGTKLTGPVGGGHTYSSPNYQVLGALVEKVSGRSFAQYLEENIFLPLGLRHSFTNLSQARANGLVPGRNLWFGWAGPSFYEFEPDRLPTASIMTSAADLGRLLAAHLQNGRLGDVRLLSESATQTMHRGVAEAGSFKYAMGLRAGPTAGLPSLWHGGALPNYRGAVVLLPDAGQAVVVLTNMSTILTDHTREIATGIVSTLRVRPLPAAERSLRKSYLVIAAVSLVLLLVQIRSLVRAWRGKQRAAVIPTLIIDLGLPLAVLVIVPRWMGVSLRGMVEGAPDVALFLALLVTLSLATGFMKLWRRNRQSGTTSRTL